MTTVTGLTAARMLAIEGASVVDGEVISGNLILTKHDGTQINAGNVQGATGPQGPAGPAGFGAIPGEVRMWPGSAVPPQATFGKWVWADGAVYASATYPMAAAHIATEWRTFSGASDPGAGNFRVPDLRGLSPVGMDAMPGGSRANRMTRSIAIVLAGRAGVETHVVSIAEMPTHFHGGGYHVHNLSDPGHSHSQWSVIGGAGENIAAGTDYGGGDYQDRTGHEATGISIDQSGQVIQHEGGGNAHENVQPSVFVPYIVCLHG